MAARRPAAARGAMRFGHADVLRAVRSLYDDELKPFGRVILKRLREQRAKAVALAKGLAEDAIDPNDMARVDPLRLRKICEGIRMFRTFPEDGKEYSVRLVNMPDTFVDICDPASDYAPEVWSELAMYFNGAAGGGLRLPAGRYACARVLASQKIPCLQGFSLGRLCHVVQLLISQQKILGYLNGQLVPYHLSDECVKERFALKQQPFAPKMTSPARGGVPLASLTQAQAGVWQLLQREPEGLPLSCVKRLFRERFHMELSETALGFAKLQGLLADPRFHGTCAVDDRGAGHVFVRPAAAAVPPGALAGDNGRPAPVPPPLPLASRRADVCWQDKQVRFQAQPPPASPVKMSLDASCASTRPGSPSPRSCFSAGGGGRAAPCDGGDGEWELVSPGASPRKARRYRRDATWSSDASTAIGGGDLSPVADEDEDEDEQEEEEEVEVSPGASRFQARRDRRGLTWSAHAGTTLGGCGRGPEALAHAEVARMLCVKNTFIHIADGERDSDSDFGEEADACPRPGRGRTPRRSSCPALFQAAS